jgi:hypothetical protein
MITQILLVNATRIMGKHPRLALQNDNSPVRIRAAKRDLSIEWLILSLRARNRVTIVCTVRLPEGFRYNQGSRKMQRVGMVSLASVFRL